MEQGIETSINSLNQQQFPADRILLQRYATFMRCILRIVVISLTLAACNNPPGTKKTKTDSSCDTLIINTASAVFTEPDSLQIDARKKAAGDADFYAGADDYMFHLNSAYEFFSSIKLKIVIAKDRKFIKFVSSQNTSKLIRLDTLPELWNVYLFDPKKEAKQIDITVIDEEYTSYFK